MDADYPILQYDSDTSAILQPAHIVRRFNVPSRCVLCFMQDVIDRLSEGGDLREIGHLTSEMGRHPVYELQRQQGAVALMNPGVGAPLAAALLEEMIALGCSLFVGCGGVGVVDSRVQPGDLIVPQIAVRDEGTSYHYLPAGLEVAATPTMVEAIMQTLGKSGIRYHTGKTWTTDAIYRETKHKVALRRSQGCLVVDMEAAALFAVAQFRGVQLAQIMYAGDDVSGATYDARRGFDRRVVRERLLSLAVEACLSAAA